MTPLFTFRSFLALAIAAAISLSLVANLAAASRSAAEQTLFDAANQVRTMRKLAPLKWSPALAEAAMRHALLMAQRKALSHQFSGEPALPKRAQMAGVRFSSVAENVAYGPSANAIQKGWMNSPPHRANLLDSESDSIGTAVVERNGTLFAVEDFATTVARLSLREQIQQVGEQLTAKGLDFIGNNVEAERACQSDKPLNLGQQTTFVMRYTTTDLAHLPGALIRQLKTGRYHTAAVAACEAPQSDFTSYQIAVLLYP